MLAKKFARVIYILLLNALCISTAIGKEHGSAQQEIDQLIKNGRQLIENELSAEKAIAILLKAYSYSDSLNYSIGQIKSTHELGKAYLLISDNTNATRYFYIFLKNAELLGDSAMISDAYLGLGLVMYNMNKWNEALENFESARVYTPNTSNNNSSSLIKYLKGLGYYHLKEYESSKEYLLQSQKLAKAASDSMRIYETRLFLNHIESFENNSFEIVKEYNRILRYFKKNDEKVGICYTLEGKARSLLLLEEFVEAHKAAHESLQRARNLNLLYSLPNVLNVVIQTEYAIGQYKEASDYLMELQLLKDSVNNIDVTTRIAMLSASHEFDKKEVIYDAELSKKNRQRLFLIIVLVTLLLVIGVIIYSLRGISKQRKISDKLLLNILPAQTVKELKATGISKAKAHKHVTIVFADVESFTTIASTLQPEVLVQMIDFYFVKFDAVIQEFELEKIKTIGDAYMFVSGLTAEHLSASKAVDASLKMLKIVQDAEQEMENKFGTSFRFRIGMHTGDIVSGVVGELKYAFDIWGDAVNIAARMEEMSIPGRLNITEDTFNLVQDNFECEKRGSIEVKNRGYLEMYFVDGRR